MKRTVSIFLLLLPFISFSQNAIIKNLYPTIKHHNKIDTLKSFCYPAVYCKPDSISWKINRCISGAIFVVANTDYANPSASWFPDFIAKFKGFKMKYTVNFNKSGFLSLTIIPPYKGNPSLPFYLTFDLTTGRLLTLNNLLNTKNDSISIRQAILPQITDSVRLFELTLDKNDPKYSDIIQALNNSLADFSKDYFDNFIFTDKELVVYYDCILPSTLLCYNHRYEVSFRYRGLRNVLKPEIASRLL